MAFSYEAAVGSLRWTDSQYRDPYSLS